MIVCVTIINEKWSKVEQYKCEIYKIIPISNNHNNCCERIEKGRFEVLATLFNCICQITTDNEQLYNLLVHINRCDGSPSLFTSHHSLLSLLLLFYWGSTQLHRLIELLGRLVGDHKTGSSASATLPLFPRSQTLNYLVLGLVIETETGQGKERLNGQHP